MDLVAREAVRRTGAAGTGTSTGTGTGTGTGTSACAGAGAGAGDTGTVATAVEGSAVHSGRFRWRTRRGRAAARLG